MKKDNDKKELIKTESQIATTENKEDDKGKKRIYLKKITYVLLFVFLILLVALLSYLFTLYNRLDDLEFQGEMNNNPNQMIETPEVTDDVEGLPVFEPETPSPTPESTPEITATPSPTPVPDGITNILIIGCDTRKRRNYDYAINSLNDVNMVLTIDENNNEIKLTSFARDTLVYYDFLNDGEGGYNRLNVALSYYNHPDGVIKTLEENFNIGIDYYMMTDFWGVEDIIDALNGVRVYLTSAETHALNDVLAAYNRTFDHPIDEHFVSHNAGARILNGRQAVSFMRIRKIDSDFGRIDRQHEVLEALKLKISDMDIVDVIKIIDIMPDILFTDMSQEEIIEYTQILYSMKNLELQHATVPFAGTWENVNYNGMAVLGVDYVENTEMLIEFVYK